MRCRFASSTAALLLCSCGVGGGAEHISVNSPESETWPLVVLLIDEGPAPSPAIPWSLAEGREGISIGMVTPTQADSPESPAELLLMEALDAGMLVALVEAGDLPGNLEREHIRIWTDSSGAPASIPEEISASIPDSSWAHPVVRQMLLRDIFDLYLPDLALIRVRTPDDSELRQIVRFWTEPDVLSSRNLIILAPAGGEGSRGWTLIGGPCVNGDIPMGLTPDNLLSTMELLLGLDWESGIPVRIPAVGILLQQTEGQVSP